jgi:hypothetical protein
MIMNISTVLGLAVTTLALLSLVSVLVTVQAMRGWRTRCLALESNLVAVRRELELALRSPVRSRQFGLSRSEADLVWRPHGRKKTA